MERLTRSKPEGRILDRSNPCTTLPDILKAGLRAYKEGGDDFWLGTDPVRGKCLIAKRDYSINDFVIEYKGEVISSEERLVREPDYELDGSGSYLVEAKWQGKDVAIDATKNEWDGTLGRLMNHVIDPNLKYYRHLLQVDPSEPPRMAFYCCKPIKAGDELLWNYSFKKDNDLPPPPWANCKRVDLSPPLELIRDDPNQQTVDHLDIPTGLLHRRIPALQESQSDRGHSEGQLLSSCAVLTSMLTPAPSLALSPVSDSPAPESDLIANEERCKLRPMVDKIHDLERQLELALDQNDSLKKKVSQTEKDMEMKSEDHERKLAVLHQQQEAVTTQLQEVTEGKAELEDRLKDSEQKLAAAQAQVHKLQLKLGSKRRPERLLVQQESARKKRIVDNDSLVQVAGRVDSTIMEVADESAEFSMDSEFKERTYNTQPLQACHSSISRRHTHNNASPCVSQTCLKPVASVAGENGPVATDRLTLEGAVQWAAATGAVKDGQVATNRLTLGGTVQQAAVAAGKDGQVATDQLTLGRAVRRAAAAAGKYGQVATDGLTLGGRQAAAAASKDSHVTHGGIVQRAAAADGKYGQAATEGLTLGGAKQQAEAGEGSTPSRAVGRAAAVPGENGQVATDGPTCGRTVQWAPAAAENQFSGHDERSMMEMAGQGDQRAAHRCSTIVAADKDIQDNHQAAVPIQQGPVPNHLLSNKPPLKHRKTSLDNAQIMRDPDVPEIFIKLYGGERQYDALHACVFCGELQTHIQTHLKHKKHKLEAAILDLQQLREEHSKETNKSRKNSMQDKIKARQTMLRNEGDHYHNQLVIQAGEGELLISRRTTTFSSSNYSPCPACHMWVVKGSHRKPQHQNVCVKHY